MQINTLVVHLGPHLDELIGLWLLRTRGEQKFPGVSKAKIVVWGKEELSRTSPEMAALSGILLVGIGGGMFDDHVPGRRMDCATTLVAKHLDVYEDPVLKFFLQEVFLADSQCEGSLQNLAEEVKNLNRYWGGSIELERLYSQIEPFIVARVERQKEYISAKKRFEECYRRRVGRFGIVAADGIDNRQFQGVARAKRAHIIVQRNEKGLTQIFGHEDADMPGLAIRIRKAEISLGKIRCRFIEDDELAGLGTLSEVPQWYFENGNLLNGSESFADVPPSLIEFHTLVGIIEKHLRELSLSRIPVPEPELQAVS